MPGILRALLGNVQAVFWGTFIVFALLRRFGLTQRIKRWFWS